ncbi:MAG: nicotinate-nucleotide adenylyltransferase [Chloroflexi bacterium]|nr:nicotinate-nucleotide adenylyltransferase [Chloroflexota bacterium]
MRVGVLGGTFDPIHIAHLFVAEEVSYKLGLAQVIFVPAGQPYLKEEKAITLAAHRLEMVRRAIASNPRFQLSTLDIERAGPTYSVDTLVALRQQQPEAQFYFIVGGDTLAELPRWREPARLAELCYLVSVARPGYQSPPWATLEAAIPQARERILVLDVPQMDISSTEIRARVAQGLPFRYLVPEAVAEYIVEHKLYHRA